MISVHGSGRSHGRTVGRAGAVVAEGHEGRAATHLASAAVDRRHTVPGPNRCSVVETGRPAVMEPDPVPAELVLPREVAAGIRAAR
jgi:hypothetical protein